MVRFVSVTCDNPMYLLPHSKEVLMAAIHNDTDFLSSQAVMDYSLLVGLDATTKELVLGIIGKSGSNNFMLIIYRSRQINCILKTKFNY